MAMPQQHVPLEECVIILLSALTVSCFGAFRGF
jgi:hypothetical protein